MTYSNQKKLDKLIEEKTNKLNNLVQQIQKKQQELRVLSDHATRMDGAISQLKELKNPSPKKH